MKIVGLVTCYFKENYGSLLQAYALQKFLDNNKIANETINIKYNQDFKDGKKKYYLGQATNINFIKSKFGMLKLKVWDKNLIKGLKNNLRIRSKKFNEFKKEFRLSRSSNTYDDLTQQAIERYSDVIVGSDQLWLPVNVVADYYTLNWVPDDINKISYSTSFGVSRIEKKYEDLYKKFLPRINNLSVREQSGLNLAKELANVNAKIVVDPTLLLTRDEWEKEAIDYRPCDEKYILCYFLGSNKEHRKYVEKIKAKTGYKIVSLNHSDEYVRYSDVFADYTPYDVGPREWISLIKNAEIVCTDSFHGTVFSILFNKLFFDFRRYNSKSIASTNSRIDSLLDLVKISKKRILSCSEEVEKVLEYSINYEIVNKRIQEIRNESQKWLLNSLTWKNEEIKHINITSKEDCCGCTACYACCPTNAITMVEDEEGFKYPKINKDKCIECGKCKDVCSVINNRYEKKVEQVGYIVNHNNSIVRKESTSGGAFSLIAQYVLSKNGVVFGATFDENWEVVHQFVDNEDNLYKFRNSKYVQSDLNDTFKKVKQFLDSDKLVCFSGTPCQIEGLHGYLGKEYEKLILVDVVCRAVPSPKVLRRYLKYIRKYKLNNENIKELKFRDKTQYGYRYSLMRIKSDNYLYQEGIDSDSYLRAFFGGYSIRPSCLNCKFKKQYRVSDFTLWDCFNVDLIDKSFDDNIGTTRVLIHSIKGKKIFEEIKMNFDNKEVQLDKLLIETRELTNSASLNSDRKQFFKEFNNDEDSLFFDRWFPINTKTRIEKIGRKTLVNFEFYKPLKRFVKKLKSRIG